jgi:hypothetical protein
MMWAILLLLLCGLFVVALWWKPGKIKAALPSVQSVLSSSPSFVASTSERDAVLEEEISIIAELIRQDEADRRRSAALDRLAALKAAAKAGAE